MPNSSESAKQSSEEAASDPLRWLPNNVALGCCAGSCLGWIVKFSIFVFAVMSAAKSATKVPYTDVDVLFQVGIGTIAGAVIGSIVLPLFVYRRFWGRKQNTSRHKC